MSFHYITFLRHGESTGNADGLVQGQADYPLTARGRLQAERLAHDWRRTNVQFDQIISSPLLRARETAETIAQELSVEIEYDPDWMERGFGSIDGHVYQEIMKQVPPPDFTSPYHPPGLGGESLLDAFQRACRGLQNVLRRPEGRYLVVAHGAILNMTMYAVLGLNPLGTPKSPRFVFNNTSYLDLTFNGEINQWRILGFTDPTIIST
jgi:probable phosphoglycerate mutase